MGVGGAAVSNDWCIINAFFVERNKHVIVMFGFYNEYSVISKVSNYNFYRWPYSFLFTLQAQDSNWSTWDICCNETSARMLIPEWTTLFRILGRYLYI